MKIEHIGWVIAITKKTSRMQPPQYELLGYGDINEPFPNELLRLRGGALFDTKENALAKIKEIKKGGDEWVQNYYFGVLRIHKQIAGVEK